MNIGIDGFEANTEKRVGIGQYAFQLLRKLHKLDTRNNYTIFLPRQPLSDMPPASKNWCYVIGTPASLWTVFQLPSLIKKENLDIFFSPTHYIPWNVSLPRLMSVMDLSYLHFPDMFKLKDLLQLTYMGKYSISHAQKIFTISEYSKKDLIDHYKYSSDDIIVTYPGISIDLNRKISRKERKFSHLEPYFLFVSTLQPRKNVVRLLEAFEQIDSNAKLVFVGKKGWLYESIFAKIAESNKRNQIIYLDYVNEINLIELYENAISLVLPSLYEGFGIPVVEAMKVGCLAVVSNNSSLPEVAGEAGIYVDPENTSDIARGMKEALQLKSTEKEVLIKKGKIQAQKFTWEQCAEKTIEVFESFKTSP